MSIAQPTEPDPPDWVRCTRPDQAGILLGFWDSTIKSPLHLSFSMWVSSPPDLTLPYHRIIARTAPSPPQRIAVVVCTDWRLDDVGATSCLTSSSARRSRSLSSCVHLYLPSGRHACTSNYLVAVSTMSLVFTVDVESSTVSHGTCIRHAHVHILGRPHQQVVLWVGTWKPPPNLCCTIYLELMRDPEVATNG
jgi:hypothetical protein